MNAVYDHIFAIVFIGIMFVWAVGVIPSLSFNNIQSANQQQLRSMELNVFNTILLDSGLGTDGTSDTVDWGSINPFTENLVTRFGLASSIEDQFYSLDPDKVQRLADGNPLGGLSYKKSKELLGLQGYGFMFQIIPPFNVTNVNGSRIDEDHSPIDSTLLNSRILSYSVKVSYLDGRPIPNAVVKSTAVYTAGVDFYIMEPVTGSTNSMGINQCTMNLNEVPYSIMVIMRVSVADVATIVVTFGQHVTNILDINMVGDEVILTEPKEPSNEVVWLMEMHYYSGEGDINHLYTGGRDNDNKINTGDSTKFELWSRNFDGLKNMNPVVMILDVLAVDGGRRELVVAGPYQNLLGYTVFEYGSPYYNLDVTVRTQRSVVIAGMTYTAELVLWTEAS